MRINKTTAAGWVNDLLLGRCILPVRRAGITVATFEVLDQWRIGTTQVFKMQQIGFGMTHEGQVQTITVEGTKLFSLTRE